MTMPSKRPTREKTVYILSVSAFLTLPVLAMDIKVTTETIVMNSPAFCGKTFVVNSKEKEYLVVMNSDKSTRFPRPLRECKLLFQAYSPYGRVCFNVLGPYARITNEDPSNLTLYDRDGRRHPLLHVGRGSYCHERREACTNSSFLHMNWAGTGSRRGPNPFSIRGTFLIQEITSRNRILSMEEFYCNKIYDLEYSMVHVVNSLSYKTYYTAPFDPKCVMHFLPPPINLQMARVCGAFFPSLIIDDFHCVDYAHPPWELIATPDYRIEKNRENILFRAKCGATKFNRSEIPTFCAPKNTTLSVIMIRSKPLEDPIGLFRLQIADWTRSEERFKTAAFRAYHQFLDRERDRRNKAPGFGLRWMSASTSSAVTISATVSFVLAETILLVVFSPFM